MTATVACVIPAYRQPGLLAEALASVMAQTLPGVVAIVVDDGCPMPETREVALEAASLHPGRVHVLHTPNGGLSAARNRGIAHALAALPDARAIYMLDADNRLLPPALERGLAQLDAAPPTIGWLYPDIDSLGMADCADCGGDFSRLSLLLDNYCEAGSLLRRDMLAAGLRYDESMRQGWEDVEFWLRCLDAGYVGEHWPQAGFRYRRRAESMLADSDRMVPRLRAAVQARHPALYDHRSLMALEAGEAPRHAIIEGGEAIRIAHDPADAGTVIDRLAFRRALWAAWADPTSRHHPFAMVFAAPGAMAALRRAGLLHWAFWLGCLKLAGEGSPMVGIGLRRALGIDVRLDEAPLDECSILFVRTVDVLRGIVSEAAEPPGRVSRIQLGLPGAPVRPGPAMPAFRTETMALRLTREEGARDEAPPPWRRPWRVSRDAMARHAFARQGLGQTIARRPGGRHIAIVQPLHTRGGVERVLLRQAVVLRQAGWRPHLFVTQSPQIEMLPGMETAYESIHPLGITGRENWPDHERGYFGAETSGFGQQPGATDALGALAGMDVVVNTHALAGHALASRLRRLGVRTVLGLHLTERGPFGEPLGQAHTALAYEYAYDMATVISRGLHGWCLGQGWPEAKLMLVRNAPGYATEVKVIPPRPVRAEGRLRLLFVGRLDAQKGLERLAATIAATRDFIEWRVAGKPVLNAAPPELGLTPERPAETAAELDSLYGWADVLYLPSRFEGVPLTILEAQRLGCVPLATDVGAVAEIIRHGEDGWLLPGQAEDAVVVAEAVDALRRLDGDRAMLARLARAAAARLAGARWEDTMADWMGWLDQAVPA